MEPRQDNNRQQDRRDNRTKVRTIGYKEREELMERSLSTLKYRTYAQELVQTRLKYQIPEF